MTIADQLRQLADLRSQGHLTEEEFVEAKRRLLAGDPAAVPAAAGSVAAAPLEVMPEIPEKLYHSSRWSAHNHLFPDSLRLARDGLVFRKGRFFGSSEEHINYRAVASLRVKNGIFFSTLSIETSGGSQPVYINGLWKSDAREIQDILRECQHMA
jgi:hypothetical protein